MKTQSPFPELQLDALKFEVSDLNDTEITIDLFFKFLNRHVLSREAGEKSQVESSSSSGHNSGKSFNRAQVNHFNKTVISSASGLVGNACQARNSKCGFCNKSGHETVQCYLAKKMSTQKRWEIAKENKLCFNCLKPSNGSQNAGNCRHPSCTVEGCGRNTIVYFIKKAIKINKLEQSAD